MGQVGFSHHVWKINVGELPYRTCANLDLSSRTRVTFNLLKDAPNVSSKLIRFLTRERSDAGIQSMKEESIHL